MSYSVLNQDGVHLCDIPRNVYQLIRRQSLSELWLYWVQVLNLVKVLIACVGKMVFVMPVAWFWVLVLCSLVAPERISDVSGLFLSRCDRVGRWRGYHNHHLLCIHTTSNVRIPQRIQAAHLLKSKANNARAQNRLGATVLLQKRNWNDIERNHERNQENSSAGAGIVYDRYCHRCT